MKEETVTIDWKEHWQSQGQNWRTEPEIASQRQNELRERLAITPNVETGTYPFGGFRLERADVEWLLANHENGKGPIEWSEIKDKTLNERNKIRKRLDLRGSNLIAVDLSHLPLSHINGGLSLPLWEEATEEQREAAAIHCEFANLFEVHFEGSHLRRAHFEGAKMNQSSLQRAMLTESILSGANLDSTHLEGAFLYRANVGACTLPQKTISFIKTWYNECPSVLEGANMQFVFCSQTTALVDLNFGESRRYGAMQIADAHLEDANLSRAEWSHLIRLGDEYRAEQPTKKNGDKKTPKERDQGYRRAIRAYVQLATVLRAQGLNDDADRFSYQGQIYQKKVFRKQRRLGAWLSSQFLDMIAGYGYQPERSLIAYLLVIFGFACGYYLIGQNDGSLFSPLGSFVFSMTSFHGRGFFPGSSSGHSIALDDPITVLAALEAFVGLIIEVSFIATFTRRFFKS